jgi:RNA polymerase-interacting CarD/CdnL/TRCF family regulator
MTKENDNKRLSIGMQVLSTYFGVGTITGIEKLYVEGVDFYVIEYGKNKSKNYFRVDGNKKVRPLSSESEFEDALQTLRFSRSTKKFESKKDRQIYINKEIEQDNLKLIIDRLAELISIQDLSPREQKFVEVLTETIAIEASIILNINKDRSYKFISKFVNSSKLP